MSFQYLRVETMLRKSCGSSSLKAKNLWPFWDTVPSRENGKNYSKKYYCFLQYIFFLFFLLGVGMYQHDIKETRLTKTLNDIVTECVSFVGENFFQHFPHISCQAWRNIFKSRGGKSIHIYLTVYPIWFLVAVGVKYLVVKNNWKIAHHWALSGKICFGHSLFFFWNFSLETRLEFQKI